MGNLLFAYLKTVYICFEMYLSEIEPFDWPIYFGPFFYWALKEITKKASRMFNLHVLMSHLDVT